MWRDLSPESAAELMSAAGTSPLWANVLMEALDQYIENQADYVGTGDDVPDSERQKLEIAEAMLDEMNAAMIERARLQ